MSQDRTVPDWTEISPQRWPNGGEAGCERWSVYPTAGQIGEMIRRSDNRGAIIQNAQVLWGRWIDGFLYLDECDRHGANYRVDRYGIFTQAAPPAWAQSAEKHKPPEVLFLRAALENLGFPHSNLSDEELARVALRIKKEHRLQVQEESGARQSPE